MNSKQCFSARHFDGGVVDIVRPLKIYVVLLNVVTCFVVLHKNFVILFRHNLCVDKTKCVVVVVDAQVLIGAHALKFKDAILFIGASKKSEQQY